jgi:hypothetical protein
VNGEPGPSIMNGETVSEQPTTKHVNNNSNGLGLSGLVGNGHTMAVNGDRDVFNPSHDSSSRKPLAPTQSDNRIRKPSLPTMPPPLSPLSDSSSAPPADFKPRQPSTESQTRPGRPRVSSDYPISPISPFSEYSTAIEEPNHKRLRNLTIDTSGHSTLDSTSPRLRPGQLQRALSTPAPAKGAATPKRQEKVRGDNTVNETDRHRHEKPKPKPLSTTRSLASPMPQSMPLPPVSIPTYLQLELSSQRPSHQYLYHSTANDFPYESSRVKIERLLNFLFLPAHLEGVLWFGMLACLDSWLYTFTILPLRLFKSFYILGQSWSTNIVKEVGFLSTFIYAGSGRMWRRRATTSASSRRPSNANGEPTAPTRPDHNNNPGKPQLAASARSKFRHHRRIKSVPSNLMPDDKADILKSLLIVCTCAILLRFDASRMYHWVRGQAAIKLYVIYNVLEVADRLFSAIGQDVLECLFSREALERKPDGHSKILRPFWLFTLALAYTVIHSTALFYQVITLNVAVNSYSNALITLLLSNQFVEIKSTVFKKFEKENLFQLTCADVVERFQLWHMLVIIAARNIAETGGLSLALNSALTSPLTSATTTAPNTNATLNPPMSPYSTTSTLPLSFTLTPTLLTSFASIPTLAPVLGPFLIVLGSEMLVDWLKHAYINKFNNTRPQIYDRFLDVLAKDYYTNAFGDQNLTKRLGLPVIPLSCLLIRAGVQTYQMAVAAWAPSGVGEVVSGGTATLASIQREYTASLSGGDIPASTAGALATRIDNWLGGIPSYLSTPAATTRLTGALIFVVAFLVLLAAKLVLGMLLLAFSRDRYRGMKEREKEREKEGMKEKELSGIYHVEGGRRVGGWGVVEVDEDKRRWIYDEDAEGLRALREREERERGKRERERERGVGVESFEGVRRYEMVAKRIW